MNELCQKLVFIYKGNNQVYIKLCYYILIVIVNFKAKKQKENLGLNKIEQTEGDVESKYTIFTNIYIFKISGAAWNQAKHK